MHHYLQYTGSQGNFFHSLPYLEPKATLQSRQLRNFRSWISAKFHHFKKRPTLICICFNIKRTLLPSTSLLRSPVPPPVFVTGPFPTHLADIPGPVWTIQLWSALSTYSVMSLGAAISDSSTFSYFWLRQNFALCSDPELGEGGERASNVFSLQSEFEPFGELQAAPCCTFWANIATPLSGRSIAIYCALKCTLHHLGFGTADCNNFYDPRTSLDVTPTPPRGPLYTHTHREGGGTWVQI